MKKTNLLAAIAGIITTTALVAGTSYASQVNADNLTTGKKNAVENRPAIEQALENKDFASWKTALEAIKTQLAAQLAKLDTNTNEDTFNKLVEAKQLMAAGKISEAKTINDKLGLQGIPGMGLGFGKVKIGKNNMTSEQRAAVDKAIADKDYATWKNLMGDKNPMAEKITADNFSQYAEAQALMKAGKFTEAQTILNKLGVDFGPGRGNGWFKHAPLTESAK